MRKNTKKNTYRPYARKLNTALLKRCSTKQETLMSIAKVRAALYK
jgi:hypothetical protein